MSAWIQVAQEAELAPGRSKCVIVENKAIAVFNVEGTYYAIDDECPHAGASLAEGYINGTELTCPWHDAVFDLTSGACLGGPAFSGVERYQTKVENGAIWVEMP
jgi:NAD(P)H-dependent nitrite reductase small subunit